MDATNDPRVALTVDSRRGTRARSARDRARGDTLLGALSPNGMQPPLCSQAEP